MQGKDRAPKRALRHNEFERSSTLLSLPLGLPGLQSKVSTRNKYVLLEERDREQRRWQEIEDEGNVLGGGPRPQWMPAANAAGRPGTASFSKLDSNDQTRLRMARVDGFNSTVGPAAPGRSRVSDVRRKDWVHTKANVVLSETWCDRHSCDRNPCCKLLLVGVTNRLASR